jgi:hypothetical protein
MAAACGDMIAAAAGAKRADRLAVLMPAVARQELSCADGPGDRGCTRALVDEASPPTVVGVESSYHDCVPTGEPARNLESGLAASLTGSVRIAIVSGGVACLAGAVAVTLALPALWRYGARAGAAHGPPPAAGQDREASAETYRSGGMALC